MPYPTLNGNVGRVWTDHGRMGVPNKGMTMVDTVYLSDVLMAGSLADRVIGGILLGEQEFISLQNGRVHGRAEF